MALTGGTAPSGPPGVPGMPTTTSPRTSPRVRLPPPPHPNPPTSPSCEIGRFSPKSSGKSRGRQRLRPPHTRPRCPASARSCPSSCQATLPSALSIGWSSQSLCAPLTPGKAQTVGTISAGMGAQLRAASAFATFLACLKEVDGSSWTDEAAVHECGTIQTSPPMAGNTLGQSGFIILLVALALLISHLSCCCMGFMCASNRATTSGRDAQAQTDSDTKEVFTQSQGTQTDSDTKEVSTQSQCTYAWWRTSPRFIPLAEQTHGAWR